MGIHAQLIGRFPSARRRLLGMTTALSLGTALAVSGGSLAHAAAGLGSGTGPEAPAMAGAAAGGPVIVVLKAQFSSMNLRTQASQRVAAARSVQAPVVSDITAHGGTDVTRLVAPDAVAARLPAAEVSRLRGDPSVAEIVPDVPVSVAGSSPAAAPSAVEPASKVAQSATLSTCPFNPAGTSKPLMEPEALSDIHAYSSDPNAPDMANSIATGAGVIVGNMGANQLAGNPNFTRTDGSHVVIDAPDYTADHSNDEDYGDVSSIAAQGTVVYQYSGALPFSDVPPGCSFVIRGDAPGASVVDLSQVDTPVLMLSQV